MTGTPLKTTSVPLWGRGSFVKSLTIAVYLWYGASHADEAVWRQYMQAGISAYQRPSDCRASAGAKPPGCRCKPQQLDGAIWIPRAPAAGAGICQEGNGYLRIAGGCSGSG